MGLTPAQTELRELAYQTWVECGQNLSEAHRRITGPMEYVISRKTMHEWKREHDWEGRAARAEAEVRRLAEASSESAVMDALLAQKERYETYFDTLKVGQMDNQATFAYSGVLKTIIDLRRKSETGMTVQTFPITHEIKTPSDAVQAVQGAIEARINGLVASPEKIDVKGLKNLKDSIELWERLEAKYSTDEPEARKMGISSDVVEQIKRDILGITPESE